MALKICPELCFIGVSCRQERIFAKRKSSLPPLEILTLLGSCFCLIFVGLNECMRTRIKHNKTEMCYTLARAICLNPFPRHFLTPILKLIQTIGNVSHGPKQCIATKQSTNIVLHLPPPSMCGAGGCLHHSE